MLKDLEIHPSIFLNNKKIIIFFLKIKHTIFIRYYYLINKEKIQKRPRKNYRYFSEKEKIKKRNYAYMRNNMA